MPGCTRPAWSCDLDHITEYNHDNPAAGGRTHPSGIADKCRFHHLLKTFSDFLDDMVLDDQGRPHTTFVTPEGLVLPGRADSVIDVIPTLGRVRFVDPGTHHPPPRIIYGADTPPARRQTRTAAKNACATAADAPISSNRPDANTTPDPHHPSDQPAERSSKFVAGR